jgi:hypothetical protein
VVEVFGQEGGVSKKTKTETKQNQSYNNTSSYGYVGGPSSADIDAVRNFQFKADPSIGFVYGGAKNQIANSFNNPTGGVYPPQMRDAILRSSLSDLAQKESQAKSEANHALQGQQFGQRSLVASLTAPRFVQTGSSGTSTGQGNTVQSSSMLPDLLAAGATGAAA